VRRIELQLGVKPSHYEHGDATREAHGHAATEGAGDREALEV
jgi:hypothetical protein